MKRFTATLLLTAMTSTLIFGGCGKTEKKSAKTETKQEEVAADDEDSTKTEEDKEEWNPATNWDYKLDNLHFSLPKDMDQSVNDGFWTLETDENDDTLAAMSIGYADGFYYSSYGGTQDDRVTENSIKAFIENKEVSMINSMEGDWVVVGNYISTKYGGYKAARFNLESADGKDHIFSTFIFNDWYGKTVLLQLVKRDGAQEHFSNDYMSIIKNMTADDPAITESTKTVCDTYTSTAKAFKENSNTETMNAYTKALETFNDLGRETDTLQFPDQVYYHTTAYDVMKYNAQ